MEVTKEIVQVKHGLRGVYISSLTIYLIKDIPLLV